MNSFVKDGSTVDGLMDSVVVLVVVVVLLVVVVTLVVVDVDGGVVVVEVVDVDAVVDEVLNLS